MITKIVLSVLSLALLLATAQAVTLSASPSRFRDAFADVTVTWSDLSRAGYFDIIEVYDAAQPDYAFTYKRTYGKKSGQVSFNLVNSRSHYGIRYVSRALLGSEEQLNQNSAILNENQPFPGNTEGRKEQWPATGLNLDAGAVWTLESEDNKETQSNTPLNLAKIGKELTSIIVEVDGTYPQQIHLSLTHEHSSMRVMWVSSTRGTVVKYGTQSGQYTNSVTGNFHTYTSDDMKQHRILPISTSYFIDPGFIHDAVMTNLLPNTRYYYVVGDGEHDFSQERSFVTAPAPESVVKQSNGQISFPEVNIFAFGDSGTSECEDMKGFCEKESSKTYNNILTDMRAKKYDFLLHFGDIAYATGFAKRWDQFFSQIEPIASAIPYMVSVGNHDYDCFSQPYRPLWANYLEDSGGECGVPYANRFHMPGVRSKQNLMAPLSQDVNKNDNLWYSFDYSGVHVIAISLEHDFTAGSEQYQWLENDLASVDRSRTPFVILMGHRPMYCSALTPTNYLFNKMMQHHLEDLLYKYHVDLTLWGHLHVYERSCPVYKTHCVEDGIVHVVAGSAGFTLNPAFFPAPKWSAYRELTHGYTRINVNPERIRVEYVRNNEHHVVDYVEIPVKKYLIH